MWPTAAVRNARVTVQSRVSSHALRQREMQCAFGSRLIANRETRLTAYVCKRNTAVPERKHPTPVRVEMRAALLLLDCKMPAGSSRTQATRRTASAAACSAPALSLVSNYRDKIRKKRDASDLRFPFSTPAEPTGKRPSWKKASLGTGQEQQK